jgi:uncharacterized membrane protein YccC
MSAITHQGGNLVLPGLSAEKPALEKAMATAGPPLLFGLRLWASVSLALYIAFWLQLDNPYWAGTSAAIVCQPQLGASLRKGWFRMIGTLTGAVMSVVLVAAFPQDRVLFLGGLALWAAVCAFLATVLRNFASYAAALAGYTVAIVGGDLLGAVGGVDANAAFLTAVSRATAICLGIACAGVVLAGTDLGGARHRLAAQFAELTTRVTAGLTSALAMGARELADAQPVRHELLRRVIGLDPIIDQTIGESSQIRYHSPVLQNAVDGLFAALAGWHAVANHLIRAENGKVQPETAAIVESIPPELRSAGLPSAPVRWIDTPTTLHRLCELAERQLTMLPAGTPSVRMLADKLAEAFTGIAQTVDGLALLVSDPARPIAPRGAKRARVADWLPALIHGGRAFVVFGTLALFWVVTGWPGGSGAITLGAIVVLLLGLKADQAYGATLLFTVGAILSLVLAGVVEFAVLPGLGTETFAGFSIVIGFCLVPIAALLAKARQPWQIGIFTGMTMVFIPLLQPTNPISYNPVVFYNMGLALVVTCIAVAVSFRLLPPLSPAFRSRRLLALTLRDLRRLASRNAYGDWDDIIRARLVAMPDAATPLQRAQLLAALSVGREIIRLRHMAYPFRPLIGGSDLFATGIDAVVTAIAQGNSTIAVAHLARLDGMLTARADSAPDAETILRMRAGILALREALAGHATFFDGGTPDEVH